MGTRRSNSMTFSITSMDTGPGEDVLMSCRQRDDMVLLAQQFGAVMKPDPCLPQRKINDDYQHFLHVCSKW